MCAQLQEMHIQENAGTLGSDGFQNDPSVRPQTGIPLKILWEDFQEALRKQSGIPEDSRSPLIFQFRRRVAHQVSLSTENYNTRWSAAATTGAAKDPRPLLYKSVRTPSVKDCLGNKFWARLPCVSLLQGSSQETLRKLSGGSQEAL